MLSLSRQPALALPHCLRDPVTAETAASTKPEPCDGLPGVATRLPLLIIRQPIQKPLAHSPVGDEAAALAAGGDRLPQIDRCDVSPASGREGRSQRSSACSQTAEPASNVARRRPDERTSGRSPGLATSRCRAAGESRPACMFSIRLCSAQDPRLAFPLLSAIPSSDPLSIIVTVWSHRRRALV